MTKTDILNFEWVKQEYEGIYEIYPHKCSDSMAFDAVLDLLHDEGYQFFRVFDGWIRAIKQ